MSTEQIDQLLHTLSTIAEGYDDGWGLPLVRDSTPLAGRAAVHQQLRQAVQEWGEGEEHPPAIITPIIHMNGDSRETLMDRLEEAYTAVMEAIVALRKCAPNGRNYYPEDGRMQKAEAQHAERMAHLGAVCVSLEAEAIQIDEETPR